MIFFSSDHHFFHNKVIQYCNRPFTELIVPGIDIISAVEVMNRTLIRNWNSVVKETDTIYFLGDLSFASAEKTIEIVKQLNGKLYWIIGNHDTKLIKHSELTSLFEWVKERETIYIQDPEATKGRYKIILDHYPLLSWDSSCHGSIHLHGHCHGTLQHPNKNALDVGVDVWNFTPVSFEQIKNKIKEKEIL